MNPIIPGIAAAISGFFFFVFLWASSGACGRCSQESYYDPEATPYIVVSGIIFAVCLSLWIYFSNSAGTSL